MFNAVIHNNAKHRKELIYTDYYKAVNADKEKELFNKLKSAILDRHIISFEYLNGKSQASIRTVEPLKLGFKSMAWYLYGYCKGKNENRFFKLLRIRNLQILDGKFSRNTPKQIFTENSVYQENFVCVKLKVMPEMAHRVYDEFDSYEKQVDGSYIVHMNYPAGKWLHSYISSYGSFCEVLEPSYLRDEFVSELKKTLNIYFNMTIYCHITSDIIT